MNWAKRIVAAALILGLFVVGAQAQSSGGFIPNQTLTATGLNSALAAKQDVLSGVVAGSGYTATDNSATINAALAAATGKFVALPAGTFHIANAITIPVGTCLVGAPGWETKLDVDKDFNASALGILITTAAPTSHDATIKPCINNIVINETIPHDIIATASAASAGSHTLSVSGATGTIAVGMAVTDVLAADPRQNNAISLPINTEPIQVAAVSGGTITVVKVSLFTGGSGYTNGTQTITVSGGTCTTQPTFQVNVVNNIVQPNSITATGGNCSAWPNGVVLSTTGGGGTGATINLGGLPNSVVNGDKVHFASPRSAAAALGVCNTTVAGSGLCKYPWAIYSNGVDNLTIEHLLLPNAWRGVYSRGSAFQLHDGRMCALDIGLDLDQSYNWNEVTDFEFWDYECSRGDYDATNGYANNAVGSIFYDGTTIAANIGLMNGFNGTNFEVWTGIVNITNDNMWGGFTNLNMDGNNSNLNITGCAWVQLQNFYSTKGAYTQGYPLFMNAPNCRVIAVNTQITDASTNATGWPVWLTNGTLDFIGGRLWYGIPWANIAMVGQQGGRLSIKDMTLDGGAPATNSKFIWSAGGVVHMQNNSFIVAPPSGGIGLQLVDNSSNTVSGNNWNGWIFTAPGPLGDYLATGARTFIYGTNYGIVADGTTPDDVAVNNALAACGAVGGTLVLPRGHILLSGATSLTAKNCSIVGQGNNGTSADLKGTTFYITMSVAPFLNPYKVSFSHLGFYWPNQGHDGVTMVVYPPLIYSTTATNPNNDGMRLNFDDVDVLNAYDIVVQASGAAQFSGSVVINSNFFAGHDFFAMGTAADTTRMTNNEFSPGRFLAFTNWAYRDWATLAANSNTLYHITNSSGTNVDGLVVDTNTFVCGIKIGIHIESGGALSNNSKIFNHWDCTRQILVIESGGCIQGAALGHGPMNTYRMTWTASQSVGDANETHDTSIVINGANDNCNILNITDVPLGMSRGNNISGTNFSMHLDNVHFGNIGSGIARQLIQVTAGSGSYTWTIRNSRFEYNGGDGLANGIRIGGTYVGDIQLAGNRFFGISNDIDLRGYAGIAYVVNNFSEIDSGNAGFKADSTNGLIYYGENRFETPPVPTLSSCGTSPSIIGNVRNGFIIVGSGTAFSCTFAWPWSMQSNAMFCMFQNRVQAITSISNSGGATTTFTAAGNQAGQIVLYNCPGVV